MLRPESLEPFEIKEVIDLGNLPGSTLVQGHTRDEVVADNNLSYEVYGLSRAATLRMSAAARATRREYWWRAQFLGVTYKHVRRLDNEQFARRYGRRERELMFPYLDKNYLHELPADDYRKMVSDLLRSVGAEMAQLIDTAKFPALFEGKYVEKEIPVYGDTYGEITRAVWFFGPTLGARNYVWVCPELMTTVISVTEDGLAARAMTEAALTNHGDHIARVRILCVLNPILEELKAAAPPF